MRNRRRIGSNGAAVIAAAAEPFVQQLESRQLMSFTTSDNGAVIFAISKTTNGSAATTSPLGEVVVALDPTAAPLSVQNFLNYVNKKAYDKTVVHRSESVSTAGIGVIQAGGYTSSNLTHIPTDPPIVNEFKASRPNARGTISMARTSDQNSATSEFFINTVNNTSLDNVAQSNTYAVFGDVISGMGLVDIINNFSRTTQNSFTTFPQTSDSKRVEITSAVARDLTVVNLGGSDGDRSIQYRSPSGATQTLSLAGPGLASVKLTGGADLKAVRVGHTIVVTGASVQIQSVDVTGSTAATSLNIAGGRAAGDLANVGSITIDGGLKAINASSVNLVGDIRSTGGIGSIRLMGFNSGGVIDVGAKAGTPAVLDINIPFLSNVSIASDIPIDQFVTRSYLVTDSTSRSITAPSINSFTVAGNPTSGDSTRFSSSLSVPVNASGRIGNVTVAGAIGATISADTIGNVRAGFLSGALIAASHKYEAGVTGIGSVNVGFMRSGATIFSKSNVGSVVTGAMTDSDIMVGLESFTFSNTLPTKFDYPDAALGILTVRNAAVSFRDSRVAAANVIRASLGRTDSSQPPASAGTMGLAANRVGTLAAAFGAGRTTVLQNLDTQAATDAELAARKINLGRFTLKLL